LNGNNGKHFKTNLIKSNAILGLANILGLQTVAALERESKSPAGVLPQTLKVV
jgi:hypothetical protein